MVKRRHNSVSSRAMLVAAFLAFGFNVTLTPAHGQTVSDVFDVFKEVVKQSQNRPGKERVSKRVDAWVMRLQDGLSSLGYYNGRSDGIYGPNTDQALARFLKDRGLQKPQPGEANALGRMVELVEAGLTEGAPNADSTQPDQVPQTDIPVRQAGEQFAYPNCSSRCRDVRFVSTSPRSRGKRSASHAPRSR